MAVAAELTVFPVTTMLVVLQVAKTAGVLVSGSVTMCTYD